MWNVDDGGGGDAFLLLFVTIRLWNSSKPAKTPNKHPNTQPIIRLQISAE